MEYKNRIEVLLNLAFDDLPDSSFTPMSALDNSAGDEVISFQKLYDQPLISIFNKLDINTFLINDSKNFIFSANDIKGKKLDKLVQFVNSIVEIYGKDEIGLEFFTQDDLSEIGNGYWSGRLWLDRTKFFPPVLLSYDSEDQFTFTVFL
ncbi:hypothetical protein [Algoriphagus marincola]|uniref:hypothetical protein n=1 Tax=Algoriphagus marincola TaxID=264027 RepID=UPI00041AA22D|nr:hypothetical protein [Algoriphagus marincola]